MLRSYEQFKPFNGKRVLVRCNFDVSVENGVVEEESAWRLDSSVPLLQELSQSGAKTAVISHRGRPEGEDVTLSLAPVVSYLASKGLTVRLGTDEPNEGEIVVRENIRFDRRESENDPLFAKELSALGDIFINDDFATAHRTHASTAGIAKLLPSAAGPLLLQEISELSRAREMKGEGLVVIIGGAKAETKVKLISYYLERGATVLTGGVIANTVLKLRGLNVGKSLVDDSTVAESVVLSEKLIVPTDAAVSTSIDKAENVMRRDVESVQESEYILDIGEKTINRYREIIEKASYIIWNGPCGLVELDEFRSGSQDVSKACIDSSAYKLAGGGDIVSFLNQEGVLGKFDYVSTGGGAMLSYLAGEELPALNALLK